MRLVFAALLSALFVQAAQAEGIFPTVTADDLNGKSHSLPADLPGDPTVVFVAYKQNQQDAINGWINALGLDPARGAQFVELPVVGTGAKLIRPVVDNGMRSGITDTKMRARTITLYESPALINTPLGFTGRDVIRVLLVRQNGQVLWSTSGTVTEQAVSELRALYPALK